MKFIKPAILESYNPRKDGTISLRFSTQEQTPEDIAQLHQMMNSFGYVYFRAEEELNQADIDKLDALDSDIGRTKTQSQRIRSVMYLSWKDNSRGYSDFKSYYKGRTDSLIEQLKRELN